MAGMLQIVYTLVFECNCGVKFNECPQDIMKRNMALIPMIYMAVESVLYFIAVVLLDGIHHDPHLKSLVEKVSTVVNLKR